MKTPSEDLHQLVRAMTKAEKRYFKILSAQHVVGDENNYVQLFDAIAAQEVYDEALLREQLGPAPYFKQFHVAKNYLYKMIMRALRLYHASRQEDRFDQLLKESQLLFDKGLYQQSSRALLKAKSLAEESENFLQLLEAYNLEHRFAIWRSDSSQLEHYLNVSFKNATNALDLHRNFLEYQALQDRVFVPYWKKGALRQAREMEALNSIFEDPAYQDPDQARSRSARLLFHNARFLYHFIRQEWDLSLHHMEAQVQLREQALGKNPPQAELKRFSKQLLNLAAIQKQLGLFEAGQATLNRLLELPAPTAEQAAHQVIQVLNLSLDLYLSSGQFQKGLQALETLQQKLEKSFPYIETQQRLGLYYNLSYLYFGAGAFSKALDQINVLLNDPQLKTREDINCFARILNLFIHFELGNEQLLDSIVDSTRRYLSRHKTLYQVEAVVLTLLRKMPDWSHAKERRQGYEKLQSELQVLANDPYERKAFEYFNFPAWLLSKVQGIPFADACQATNKTA